MIRLCTQCVLQILECAFHLLQAQLLQRTKLFSKAFAVKQEIDFPPSHFVRLMIGNQLLGSSQVICVVYALSRTPRVAAACEGDDAEFLKIRVEQRRDVFFFVCCSI